jgi:hypothetical protein
MPLSLKWREDIAAADAHSRTHAKPSGCPPHWTRCNWMKGKERCVKASGHDTEHLTLAEKHALLDKR